MASNGSALKSSAWLGRGPQIVAVALVVGLLGAMAIEPTRQLLAQRDRIDDMSGDLSKVETTNEKLRARIARLQDPDYIEQQAREQAGLVMPGEIAYRVMAPSEDVLERKEAKRAKAVAPPPPEPGLMESFLDFLGFI